MAKLKRADHVLNDHLQAAWRRAMRDGIDAYAVVQREERFFGLIALLDPANGRYLNWLSKWRRRQWDVLGVGKPCSLEELEGVREALAAYRNAQASLPSSRRDIGAFRTVEELQAAVSGLPAPPADPADEKAEALRTSELLFDRTPWRLVKLNGKIAARWWGRGTRWCTARDSGDHYGRYARQGDLLVLIAPTGRYQLFPTTGEIKDAQDHDVTLQDVLLGAPLELKRLLSVL